MIPWLFTMCMAPVILMNAGRAWEKRDTDVLNRAYVVCEQRYNKCVKEFRVERNYHYNVICGGSYE